MNKCPYCGNEMEKRVIEADGRNALICIEGDKKRKFIDKFTNKDCIVLDDAKINDKARVECEYCESCKKIIIDIK